MIRRTDQPGFFGANPTTVNEVLRQAQTPQQVPTASQIWRRAFVSEVVKLPPPIQSNAITRRQVQQERDIQREMFKYLQITIALAGVVGGVLTGTLLVPAIIYAADLAFFSAVNTPRAVNTANQTVNQAARRGMFSR